LASLSWIGVADDLFLGGEMFLCVSWGDFGKKLTSSID
jgi:hypothetical protein